MSFPETGRTYGQNGKTLWTKRENAFPELGKQTRTKRVDWAMNIEPSEQLIPSGSCFHSPGGRFTYQVQGPACRLYDREELPWPSCSLQWRGKQPSWNRVGKRFVPDMAATRCPSYSVHGCDAAGTRWEDVITLYWEKMEPGLRQWWVTQKPQSQDYPVLSETFLRALD